MELIIEFLFDLIVEGSIELLPNRKVPMVLRILAGLAVAAVCGVLILLGIQLMLNGIVQQDWPSCAVGTFLWVLTAAFGIIAWRKANKEESKQE